MQYRHRPGSGKTSFHGLFFSLTGALIATSLVNVGDSGVPFFYLATVIPLLDLILSREPLYVQPIDAKGREILALIGTLMVALLLTTLLQISLGTQAISGELGHLASRSLLLAYFLISVKYLRGRVLQRGLIWLRRILIIVCAYGVYQVPAKVFAWPLFLDWLRNNKSFFQYDYNSAGWIPVVRATSVYAEPSQATIPIIVLLLLNIQVKSGRLSRITGWTSWVLFTLATLSRTAWVAIAAVVLGLLLALIGGVRQALQKRRLDVYAVLLLIAIVLPCWSYLRVNSQSDLSEQERSGSIILGLNMIRDSPFIGLGWNSFAESAATTYSSVIVPVSSDVSFPFIHNMLISYWQQAGIAGFVLAMAPFFILVRWSTAPVWMTLGTLTSFLAAAEFGGDIGYWSLTWLWLAILVNMNTAYESNTAPKV
jgi:O-antigen ligase